MSITNYRDANRSQAFTYDSLNRLTSAWSSASTGAYSWGENYTIDAWGNLQISPMGSKTHGGNFQVSGNAQNRPTGLVYDAAGNLMSYVSATYTYDQENRLSSTAGTSYTYDGNGERVLKSNSSTGAPTKHYWSMDGNMLAEGDGSGNLTAEYIYFGGKRVARIDLPANTIHYYLSDHLGSTSLVASAVGTVEEESDYYPFGTEVMVTGPGTNELKFIGKETDMESGLDLMGARYHSSGLGRFLQTDPLYIEAHRLADPQLLNLYAYSRNNPITLSDPTGLDVGMNCDTGANCNKAVNDLNNRKGAQFKVELGKDGKLHIIKGSEAKKLSTAEQALKGAINNPDNHATINVSGDTGQSEFGTHDSPGVNSVDLGNLSKLDAPSNAGGLNSGDALAHEVMDAYNSWSMGAVAADQAAAALYPGVYRPTDNHNNLNPSGTAVTSSTYYQGITDGRGGERVGIQFITPIPAIDADSRFNSLERRNEAAHDAGSRVTGVTFEPKQ
jgi:RHS repeat-associated protein